MAKANTKFPPFCHCRYAQPTTDGTWNTRRGASLLYNNSTTEGSSFPT